MQLQKLIEKHWYIRIDPILFIILFPFSLIFELMANLRKLLFTLRIKRSKKVKVPVVVIGNITVGGAGKTPLTKNIAHELTQQGIKVGIILRGYKSSAKGATIVTKNSSSDEVGDEAIIYAQAGFNVAIASKRVAAAELLLKEYPDTQLILADDGMQHYYLARDMEICVVDSSRMFGNQQLLPLGPLREDLDRLKTVSAIVVNGDYNQEALQKILSKYKTPVYYQSLEFINFYNPVTQETKTAAEMSQQEIVAMAAIGNPGRFYNYLEKLGQKIKGVKTFPDHYHYQQSDIPANYAIITTEKDYTKLAKYKLQNVWVAQVAAKLNNELLINNISKLVTH